MKKENKNPEKNFAPSLPDKPPMVLCCYRMIQGGLTVGKPKIAIEEFTLLQHFERIIDLSEENGLDDHFFVKAKANLECLSVKLDISPLQAALFSLSVAQGEDASIGPQDIADSTKWKIVKVLQYMNDFDELARKKLLTVTKDVNRSKRFRVTPAVMNALIKNTPIEIKENVNLDIFDFFDALESLVDLRKNNEINSKDFIFETDRLLENNKHLKFSQTIKSFRLEENLQAVLLFFCELFVNDDDDEIIFGQIEDAFESTAEFGRFKNSFRSKDNILFEKSIIENATSNGFCSGESFKITDKAKKELFSEINIHAASTKSKKDLILSSSIAKKELFYNQKEEQKIRQLIDMLKPDNYNAVLKRLSEKGMRNGFACLFYGRPGTGKTETVNQISKETGRNILRVDIAETKSCWFGESEKLIKEIFDKYRTYVEECEIAPILLFNEADAIIGKRKDVTTGSVAQTENAIQNIILQELENLKGILIATTNLTQNLDKAFERRFLFKIEFDKPSLEARKSIWITQIPELKDNEAASLAENFDFTGGQIENIARKYVVDSVLSGKKVPLETLFLYCQDENLAREDKTPIGFKTL
jgi:SpoVK/Ycf46/Vps4 family AAA+-type ATPase